MSSTASKISVIIPVKNEENTIADVIKCAERYAFEIIIVDGQSTDGTKEILNKTDHHVIFDNGRGKGEAIRLGIQAVRGEIIVTLDADGSHDPREIPNLVLPITQGNVDMVLGSRIRGGSDEFGGTPYDFTRLIGNALITLFINMRYKTSYSDTQNGFKAIRAGVLKMLDLQENGHTIELEIILKCLNRGYSIIEVPVHEYRRLYGKSSIQNRKIWYQAILCVLKNIR